MTARAGFSVETILVEGRRYTDSDALKAIMNLDKGEPLLAFNIKAARNMIAKLSWVKSVHVERRLPNTIYVQIKERKPFALWQREKRLSLIDKDGFVLTEHNLNPFRDLVIIVGKGAEKLSLIHI